MSISLWFIYYRWVNEPPCDRCGNNTVSEGMGAALPLELRFGGSRVEIYRYAKEDVLKLSSI